MFLAMFFFFGYLSLDVLIKGVLLKKKIIGIEIEDGGKKRRTHYGSEQLEFGT